MKLKKLLALLVALIMGVCVFAACDGDVTVSVDKDDDEKTEETKKDEKKANDSEEPAEEPAEEEVSDEEAVEEVVVNFVSALFSGDDEALDYLSADAPKDEIEPVLEQMAMIKDFTFEDMGIDTSALSDDEVKQAEDIMGSFIDALFDSIDVTVESVEIDGDEAVASMKLSMMDMNVFADFATEIDDLDDIDAMEDAMDGLIEEALDNPMEETGDCILVKEDGEWKVSNME